MEEIKTIKEKTIELIDALKATCQTYGMGNDGNEYKIITQVFLYKFLNDKFGYEVKKVSPVLKNAEKWELVYAEMSEDDRLDIFDSLPSDIPLLNPEHLIANLWNQQAKGDFDLIFDSTMTDIADKNKPNNGKERYYTGTYPKEYLCHKGDLIVAMTQQAEGLLGSTALVPENNKYLHNQRIGLITCDEKRLNKLFAYYLFMTKSVRDN